MLFTMFASSLEKHFWGVCVRTGGREGGGGGGGG